MRLASGTAALLAAAPAAFASPLQERQACPNIHIFGARETTAPAGYGSAGTFVNLILNAYPGSTAEAINYPAAGGTNAAYASSVQQGTQDIANQINNFNNQCPNSKLVVVGYSQVSFIHTLIWLRHGLPSHREQRSGTTPYVVAATLTKASPTPTLSSPLLQANRSKQSSGQATLGTHRRKHSTTAVAPQAG